jgi:hypothetical protein
MMSEKEVVDVAGETYAETDKAILFSDDGDIDNARWLPKSQIEIFKEGKAVTVTMPMWLAKDKGYV